LAEPEVVMMSISEQERQTLESIENELVLSAPKLASMLAIFTRLTASEKMPARRPVGRSSGLRPRTGCTAGPPAPGQPRRARPRQPVRHWLWLPIAVALLALTVMLGHGTGRTTCTAGPAAAVCRHAPAPVRPAVSRPG
jgi:hypothetical protein